MKSVLVDFLVSAGIKTTSIVSYNHLGNNDGKNLSAPEQFRSKEISKSNVVDDMVQSNKILYSKDDEHPDHVVVIKYVPYVGDSKRALDEYTSEIFLGGKNTIVMHNTCEDSLLATPLIIDLVVLCEVCERIRVKREGDGDEQFERFHPVLSLLSYLLKAPMVPQGAQVINALSAQRQSIVNIFRALLFHDTIVHSSSDYNDDWGFFHTCIRIEYLYEFLYYKYCILLPISLCIYLKLRYALTFDGIYVVVTAKDLKESR